MVNVSVLLTVLWVSTMLTLGEGNGNPFQCSCLENPRDRGAWWAAVYGVAQSRARWKRLSSSSSSLILSGSFVSERGSHRRGSPGVALGLGIKADGTALSCELPHVSPSAKHRWLAVWPSPEQARGSFPDTSGTWHLTSLLENILYQAFTWKN